MSNHSLDILAIGAHPDDVELSCAGTLIKHIQMGYSVGLIDLTQGELGTRGSGPLRLKEAEASRQAMGAAIRENLDLGDGFFENDRESIIKLIRVIRKYRPKIILANAKTDRHPDHGRGSELVRRAAFLSGLVKIETHENDKLQAAFRPNSVYYYIQDRHLQPDLVVDISEQMDKKLECIMCFKSQFYDPQSKDPETPISSLAFLEFVKAKSRNFGRDIQVEFAEGFNVDRVIGVSDLLQLS